MQPLIILGLVAMCGAVTAGTVWYMVKCTQLGEIEAARQEADTARLAKEDAEREAKKHAAPARDKSAIVSVLREHARD